MSVLGDVYSPGETMMKGSSPKVNITSSSTPTTPTTTGHRVTWVICLLYQHLFSISCSFQVMPVFIAVYRIERKETPQASEQTLLLVVVVMVVLLLWERRRRRWRRRKSRRNYVMCQKRNKKHSRHRLRQTLTEMQKDPDRRGHSHTHTHTDTPTHTRIHMQVV